jgi:hypothetical protein
VTYSDSSIPKGRAPAPCDHEASAVCSVCISRTCSCSACRPAITCPAWQRRDGVDLEPWGRQPEPPVGAPMDLFAAAMIIDGEQEGDELEAYALMIRTGVGWSLQGRIGRAMASLIDNSIIDRDGRILVDHDVEVECDENDIVSDPFTIEAVDTWQRLPGLSHPSHQFATDDDTVRCTQCSVLFNGMHSGLPCNALIMRDHSAIQELRAMAEDELHMPNERRADWGRGT